MAPLGRSWTHHLPYTHRPLILVKNWGLSEHTVHNKVERPQKKWQETWRCSNGGRFPTPTCDQSRYTCPGAQRKSCCVKDLKANYTINEGNHLSGIIPAKWWGNYQKSFWDQKYWWLTSFALALHLDSADKSRMSTIVYIPHMYWQCGWDQDQSARASFWHKQDSLQDPACTQIHLPEIQQSYQSSTSKAPMWIHPSHSPSIPSCTASTIPCATKLGDLQK